MCIYCIDNQQAGELLVECPVCHSEIEADCEFCYHCGHNPSFSASFAGVEDTTDAEGGPSMAPVTSQAAQPVALDQAQAVPPIADLANDQIGAATALEVLGWFNLLGGFVLAIAAAATLSELGSLAILIAVCFVLEGILGCVFLVAFASIVRDLRHVRTLLSGRVDPDRVSSKVV
jgi:hypothetical protein